MNSRKTHVYVNIIHNKKDLEIYSNNPNNAICIRIPS